MKTILYYVYYFFLCVCVAIFVIVIAAANTDDCEHYVYYIMRTLYHMECALPWYMPIRYLGLDIIIIIITISAAQVDESRPDFRSGRA